VQQAQLSIHFWIWQRLYRQDHQEPNCICKAIVERIY
jgi:hypothetical protein